MSSFALSLVLSAAVLHASWNALVKAASDRALVIAAVSAAHAAGGLLLIAISPSPAMASWPNILASTLIHYFYYVLLFQAYRLGDLARSIRSRAGWRRHWSRSALSPSSARR